MNYYAFHHGDYRAATAHLSNDEDLAYRRLLDMYYDTEAAIPLDIQWVSRRLRVGKEHIENVLADFFELKDDGYHHTRCDMELAEYAAKADKARENGRKGGRRRSDNKPSPNPTLTEPVSENNQTLTKQDPIWLANTTQALANQEPLTSNQVNTPIPPEGGESEKPTTKAKAAISLKTYLADCKQRNVKPIPEDCAVFEYAKESKIPDDFLRLHWLEFRDRYTVEGAKRYKSWTAAFTKSVRGNWFRLWYFDDRLQDYALTTTGMQAKNTHEGRP